MRARSSKLTMRIRSIQVLLTAAALLLFSDAAFAARKTKKEEPNGTLSGRVISDYKNVPTAIVHVWLDKKEIAKGPVDADAVYHFKVKPGTYEVQAEAPNLRPALAVRIIVVVHDNKETWANIEMVH